MIYNSSFIFHAYGIWRSSIDCIPEPSNIVTCCYEERESKSGATVGIYCTTCYDDGKGNLACGEYEKIESSNPTPPPGPGQGGPGNVLPQSPQGLQTNQTPVPKSGLG